MSTVKMAAGALLVCVGVGLLVPPAIGGVVAVGLPMIAAGASLFALGVLDVMDGTVQR